MSYQVLARKWRPKLFEALVGQEHVVRALSNALEQQRLHHAYLFTGTRGVGKTTLARILAKSLNCETGITPHPCGQCTACVEIDKGRFVDMLEVDAASNTQVDSMRELLENAQYAPTAGRFKVYIIDEVHMLSRSAFNAMLKTLEEPPAHVKFILATTDPQKMPVTVLSRCLQFNLRQMPTTAIVGHLENVLTQENIAFENVALQLISRAASGSMRDALSLLDQAIAYGGGSVHEAEVRAMLGAVDQSYLFNLLNALIAGDGRSLLDQARSMEERSLSFDTALANLATLLQQVAVAQAVPDSIPPDLPERTALLDLAGNLPAERLQLYYQIALLGRRDLGLSPDPYAGFTMSLLRMLAFQPDSNGAGNVSPAPNKASVPSAIPPTPSPTSMASARDALRSTVTASPVPTVEAPIAAASVLSSAPQPMRNVPMVERDEEPPIESPAVAPLSESLPTADLMPADPSGASNALAFDGDWRGLVDRLKLGLARALAQHCELKSFDDNQIALSVPDDQKHLLDPNYQDKLRSAIQQHFGRKLQIHFSIGGSGNTPAQQINQEKAALQSKAESSIREDQFVQALMQDFGAQIVPSSIKPLQQ